MEAASRPQGISNNLAWQVNLYPISSRHKIRGLQNFIQWRTLFRNWLLFARHSTRYWGQDVNKTDTRHQRESAEDAAVYHVTVSQAVWNRFVVLGDLSVSSFYISLKKKQKTKNCGMLINFPLQPDRDYRCLQEDILSGTQVHDSDRWEEVRGAPLRCCETRQPMLLSPREESMKKTGIQRGRPSLPDGRGSVMWK